MSGLLGIGCDDVKGSGLIALLVEGQAKLKAKRLRFKAEEDAMEARRVNAVQLHWQSLLTQLAKDLGPAGPDLLPRKGPPSNFHHDTLSVTIELGAVGLAPILVLYGHGGKFGRWERFGHCRSGKHGCYAIPTTTTPLANEQAHYTDDLAEAVAWAAEVYQDLRRHGGR